MKFEERMSKENLSRYPKMIPWALFDNQEITRLVTAVKPTPGDENGSAIAFWVPLRSWFGVEREMKDMINFVSEVDRAGLAWLLKKVFYDSKANVCSIEFSDDDTAVLWREQLKNIADNTLEQHCIFGTSGGYGLDEEDISDDQFLETDWTLKNQKYFWRNDPFVVDNGFPIMENAR